MKKDWDNSDSVTILAELPETRCARYLQFSGRVQGVGFRPYVVRLAREFQLNGWVRNTSGIVEVMLQGDASRIDEFILQLPGKSPELAQPVLIKNEPVKTKSLNSFEILASQSKSQSQSDSIITTAQHNYLTIPPDQTICDDCLAELHDPENRRYHYPFINCTQCGPRYTLIKQLPYDRASTTMSGFQLCDKCQDEYTNINDRRYHAEPIACADCGPELSFHIIDHNSDFQNTSYNQSSKYIIGNDDVLTACVNALRQGKIIAVKGIGGYHLMCDARNEKAINILRERKRRPARPLAVMYSAGAENKAQMTDDLLHLDDEEKAFLLQSSRPILLVGQRNIIELPEQLAPGLKEVGVMIAYSPLHQLLLNEFSGPLVATSANFSGEPVLFDNVEAESRLNKVVDGYLHHNRPIERPADDSVFKKIYGKPRPLRIGRGITPLELELPFVLQQPVLAVGAQMKNTFTLAWDNRAVMSPHLGDMQSPGSLVLFENTLKDFQQLYNIEVNNMVCDAHPGYTLRRWAQQRNANLFTVYHHHAHAAAAWYESKTQDNIICFCWDGLGYGEDSTLWGGEAFIGKPSNWKRVASLRPFHLQGGDTVASEPWRSAAALCWEAGLEYTNNPELDPLIKQAWQKKINTQQTSSMGRLFDAVAALSGVAHYTSYDAEAPMRLEALCDSMDTAITLPMYMDDGVMRADWQPLIQPMQDKNLTERERSNLFHATMVELLVQQSKAIQQQYHINHLAFSGGVFQNRILTEIAIERLKQEGFNVYLAEKIPLNDAGISVGQLIEYGFSISSS